MESTRVLIVDDHTLFAEALTVRLSSEPDLVVLPYAGDTRRALALVATEHPDVVVLDLMLGEESGLDLMDRIHERDSRVRVVVLTATSGVESIVEVLRHGAIGWLSKTEHVDRVIRVIRSAARRGGWIPPDLLGDVLRLLVRDPDPNDEARLLPTLTTREGEILQCMVDGRSRAEIADYLGLSANTVRTHVQNLLAKLGVHSGLEAITVAMRAGMRPFHPPDT